MEYRGEAAPVRMGMLADDVVGVLNFHFKMKIARLHGKSVTFSDKGRSMIDNEKEVAELLRDMEQQRLENQRAASPRTCGDVDSERRCVSPGREVVEIGSVLYMGDVRGMACGLKMWARGKQRCGRRIADASRVDDSRRVAAQNGVSGQSELPGL